MIYLSRSSHLHRSLNKSFVSLTPRPLNAASQRLTQKTKPIICLTHAFHSGYHFLFLITFIANTLEWRAKCNTYHIQSIRQGYINETSSPLSNLGDCGSDTLQPPHPSVLAPNEPQTIKKRRRIVYPSGMS